MGACSKTPITSSSRNIPSSGGGVVLENNLLPRRSFSVLSPFLRGYVDVGVRPGGVFETLFGHQLIQSSTLAAILWLGGAARLQ